MHDDVNSRGDDSSGQQTFGEILQTVGAFEAKGRHGSGENYGRGERAGARFQIEAGFDHGVGAVRDHDRCIEAFFHCGQNEFAIGDGHIEAVLIHQVRQDYLSFRKAQARKVAIDFELFVNDGTGLFGIDFLHGATGGEQVDSLGAVVHEKTDE